MIQPIDRMTGALKNGRRFADRAVARRRSAISSLSVASRAVVEPLELRTLLSSYTVNTLADDNTGGLSGGGN